MATNPERAARIFKNGCDGKTNLAELLFRPCRTAAAMSRQLRARPVCNLKKKLAPWPPEANNATRKFSLTIYGTRL
jgi:hypothetical protein